MTEFTRARYETMVLKKSWAEALQIVDYSSLVWSTVVGEVQERWVSMSQILRAVDTMLMNVKPVHDEEPGQGFKQRSGMIFLNHKSDFFMTMLRMYGRVKKLAMGLKRQW